MSRSDAFVAIARLVRTQGRHGEIAADLLTDFPHLFDRRRRVTLLRGMERGDAEIERHWFHKGRVVLKFLGIDSISAAEAWLGATVEIPAEERAPLEPGSVYVGDLIGCLVHDRASGRDLGRVTEVQGGSGDAPLLVVRSDGPPPHEYLVPFVLPWVEHMDRERLELRLPEGLLALDAPLTPEEKEQQRREAEAYRSSENLPR